MSLLRRAVGCGVAVAAALAGCGEPPLETPAQGAQSPPVVLLSLDTVRADAVAQMPNLSRLGEESIRFPAAVSEIPFTLPAHLTMLTGAAPDVHGVFGEGERLPAEIATLAEVVSAAGYATAAVVSSDWLREGFGFARGFERYDEVDYGLQFRDRVTRAALEVVDAHAGDPRPLFLFVHYYDAHSDPEIDGNGRPYWAPERFSGDLEPECLEALCSPEGRCATGYLLWASHNPDAVDAATRECLLASYLAGTRALDAAVGELLGELRARGLYDRALIVATSDHGEEFGEHGQFVHAQTFHESVAVPLSIRLPGGEGGGGLVHGSAQLADVVPTLLGALDLERPLGVTGVDLLAAEEERPAVAQNKHRPERYALSLGHWKLIHDYVTGRASLFDRSSDPGEVVDLAAELPHEVARLKAVLDERVRSHRRLRQELGVESAAPEETLTPEARERLRSLGYLD